MPARLIINADDFGLTPGINRTIEDLHRAGVLTSATLMATGPAFDDAVRIAHRNPALGIGCHVVLTDGSPASSPASIPSLLGPDRLHLRTSLPAFALAALRGQLAPADIRTEALAQIRRLQAAGIAVTHIDTHKHTHMFSAVTSPLLDAAEQAGIPAIRNPFEPPSSLALAHGTRRLQVQLLRHLRHRFHANLRRHSVHATSGTLGIAATGRLDTHTLRQILQTLPPTGTWELVCHPGLHDTDLDRVSTRLRSHREIERDALLEVLPHLCLQPGAPALIHFGELVAAAQDPSLATSPPRLERSTK